MNFGKMMNSRVVGFYFVVIIFVLGLGDYVFALDRVFYIDDEGCSDNWTGTESQPWCTFGRAFSPSGMGAGDTLIVKDGTYVNNVIVDPPAGMSSHYTVIKAEHDGKATIDDQHANTGGYPGNVIQVGTDYIRIEGLRFVNGAGHVAAISGSHVHIKNTSFGNANPSGSVVSLTGTHILLEDAWAWGAGCSMIFVGGSIHGCTEGLGENITLRRVVVRSDYAKGTGGCHGVIMYGADDVKLENVIALDFNSAADISSGNYRTGFRSRDGYCAKDHMYKGCIALNLPVDISGLGYQGFELNNVGQARNSIAWDIGADAFAMRRYDSSLSLDHVTAGNADRGVFIRDQTLSNSLVMHTKTNSLTSGSTHNHFFSSPEGGQNTTTGDPGLKHLPQIEKQSFCSGTASDGGDRGATILFRTENGQLTSTPLWPWPNEARIKQDFSTTFDNIPVENQNPKRGFCADGQGLHGSQITLTSYIWEYLNEPCPKHICHSEGNIPFAPANLKLQ